MTSSVETEKIIPLSVSIGTIAGRIKRSQSAAAALAMSLLWPAGLATSSLVEAKTPGKTYCFYRVCHRVMTLDETRRAMGKPINVVASHYDDPKRDRFNPTNLTSSGEWFRADVPDNAASPTLPNGTIVLAWNPATKQSAVLRINNAGPYWKNRTLDVSRAAASRLGFERQGVAPLRIQILHAATREDVAYRKGRRYAQVPGPIGTHASFDLALADARTRLLGDQPAPAPLDASTIAIASTEPAPTPATAAAATVAQAQPAPESSPSVEASPPQPITPDAIIVASLQPPEAPTAAVAAPIITASLAPTPAGGQSRPNARDKSQRQPARIQRPAAIVRQEPLVRARQLTPPLRTAQQRSLTSAEAANVVAANRRPTRISGTTREIAPRQADVAVVRAPRQAALAPRRPAQVRFVTDYVPAVCRGASLSCEFMGIAESPARSVRSASAKRP